jgi:LacI family purine nucleotide synthesis repressor
VAVSDARFEEAGYDAVEKLLTSEELPTVIFAAYSHIALGADRCLADKGFCVPNDMSLVCMDDILANPYREKQLSCIRTHIEEQCASAIELLFTKLRKGHSRAKRSVSITREFSVGETIAKPSR